MVVMNRDMLKELKNAYEEACNCGYAGDFVQYVMKIGANLEDIEK